ncbi:unnamed protein product, partial [Amoebophrya sp. A120]
FFTRRNYRQHLCYQQKLSSDTFFQYEMGTERYALRPRNIRSSIVIWVKPCVYTRARYPRETPFFMLVKHSEFIGIRAPYHAGSQFGRDGFSCSLFVVLLLFPGSRNFRRPRFPGNLCNSCNFCTFLLRITMVRPSCTASFTVQLAVQLSQHSAPNQDGMGLPRCPGNLCNSCNFCTFCLANHDGMARVARQVARCNSPCNYPNTLCRTRAVGAAFRFDLCYSRNFGNFVVRA